MTDADPVNPMRIFHELSLRLPANAIVAADSGSAANWYARHLKFHGDIRGSLSGTLATMGPGVPYVIGAKWAHPDRPAIALVGDGAMQMNGMAELITVAHYWQQWADPRLIVAILHNNDLNQVTWEMRAMEGAPKFAESQTLPDVDFAAFARSLGLSGVNIDTPDAIGPAWEQALAADRPDRARHPLRPERAADPAARHLRPGQSHRRRRSCTATRTPGASSSRASSRRRSSTCPAPRTRTDMRSRHRGTSRVAALVADAVHDVRTGRFERSLSALTAAGAVITDGRDLPVPRRGQLRQQDDVVADRDRADRGPGRDRVGVLPPRRAHRAAARLGGHRRQRPAGHLPAPARGRATPRRDHPLQPGVRSAGVRAAARLPRRRHGTAGRGAAPRRPAAARRSANALPQPPVSAPSPRRTGAATPASTSSTTSTRGTTSPPVSSWLGSRCPANWPSSPPTEVGIAAPLLDLLLAQDSDPRVPVLALIDARLAAGETDGWHYDDMPEDAQAWRDTLRALDEEAPSTYPAGTASRGCSATSKRC